MAGIQISGLVANSAFDWKSVVDQLIAVDGTPITTLQNQQTANTSKITALSSLQTSLTDLQASLQNLRAGNYFSGRTVSSDTANTTWTSSSSNGAPIGTYTFAIQNLATTAKITGKSDIGRGLNGASDVTGLTLASLNTSSPLTAGAFTINGQQVSVATTDTLQDVFANISAATGGDVTASYDAAAQSVTLTSASGPITLGDPGDTANFLSVMKLADNGTDTISSSAPLGSLAGNDVSGLTIANLNTAVPITAGVFTVNGQQVTIAGTDSLQDVFDHIHAATGNDVTASYDSASDTINLTSLSGQVVLSAANDTSNFLQVMKLANNGGASVTSSSPLGTLRLSAHLADAGLATPLTGLDASGNGSFKINGVTINYNATTGSLAALISTINQSGAGVTASYDTANDRISLVNNTTGDVGIGFSDTTGNLLAALGLTTAAGGAFSRGENAQFTVNGGPALTSMSNTLDGSVTGIAGLSVTVNSETTQTVQVGSDTAGMQTAIQDFITKFNAVQSFISTNTKITTNGTNVTTSILSDNREVQDWATQLQSLAFNSIPGLTGTVKNLDNLGIGFTGTTGQLTVTNSDQLAAALTNHPDDVQNFFLTANTGFVSKMFGYLTNIVGNDAGQQSTLTKANSDLDTQIATLQSRLDTERVTLTNAFIAMQDAQSQANSTSQYLTATFFKNTTTSCWVARAAYGTADPRWLLFRFWLLHRAPAWFRGLYLRHGSRFATWVAPRPRVRAMLRRWMDARIASLPPF